MHFYNKESSVRKSTDDTCKNWRIVCVGIWAAERIARGAEWPVRCVVIGLGDFAVDELCRFVLSPEVGEVQVAEAAVTAADVAVAVHVPPEYMHEFFQQFMQFVMCDWIRDIVGSS